MICERCGIEHSIKYGSGRYCSKKCAFTKNENQLFILRKPKSEEAKQNMRKPKKDSSKMGKYDKFGDNNPNSKKKNGELKDRNNFSYNNICKSNKENGLRWKDSDKKNHSEKMKGDSNWMRGKKHTEETKIQISNTKKNQYKLGLIKNNIYCISKAEKEIGKILEENNIIYKSQYSMNNGKYFYDFYIPEKNLIIEYNGDFWHGNPEKYNENDIIGIGSTKMKAKNKWEIDKNKKEYAILKGYEYITIWESDYLKNKNIIIELIL
jgi:hypothetical protein